MKSTSDNSNSSYAKTFAGSPIAMENLETRQMLSASVNETFAPCFAAENGADVSVSLRDENNNAPVAAIGNEAMFAGAKKGASAFAAGTGHLGHGAAMPGARRSRGGRGVASSLSEPAVDGNVAGWTNVSRNPLWGSNGPSPDDVVQGQTGDCYFLASLSDMAATDPQYLEQHISERADGTYDVYFLRSNRWSDIHVDGYLPVNRSGSLEYASLGGSGATWVAIIEKAFTYFRYASYGAAYSYISNGWPDEAFADMGVTDIRDYGRNNFGSGSAMVSQMYQDLSAGRSVEFATVNSGGGPLVNGHVYSVINVEQESDGSTYVLVRNPWGNDGPNGDGYQWVNSDSMLGELSRITSANA